MPLRVGARLVVLTYRTIDGVLVDRLLHGRDEVAEEHLTSRRLDAIQVPMHVVKGRREQFVLSRLDERVRVGVSPVSFLGSSTK